MEVKETSFKAEIGNQKRNQLAKISSNATINRSAGTRKETHRLIYG